MVHRKVRVIYKTFQEKEDKKKSIEVRIIGSKNDSK